MMIFDSSRTETRYSAKRAEVEVIGSTGSAGEQVEVVGVVAAAAK
jgi:hypothetical protein